MKFGRAPTTMATVGRCLLIGLTPRVLAGDGTARGSSPRSTRSTHTGARLYLAACQVELGRTEAARQTVAKIAACSPDMTARYVRKLLHARDPALVERLLGALAAAGLPDGEVGG